MTPDEVLALVTSVTNDVCSCGGAEPAHCCEACEVFHGIKAALVKGCPWTEEGYYDAPPLQPSGTPLTTETAAAMLSEAFSKLEMASSLFRESPLYKMGKKKDEN
jgi:hypothetical protein